MKNVIIQIDNEDYTCYCTVEYEKRQEKTLKQALNEMSQIPLIRAYSHVQDGNNGYNAFCQDNINVDVVSKETYDDIAYYLKETFDPSKSYFDVQKKFLEDKYNFTCRPIEFAPNFIIDNEEGSVQETSYCNLKNNQRNTYER